MLSTLLIKNYALIEEIEIRWQPGFSVITGETGAGKSIIIGALQLLTGIRADAKILQKSDQKCVVEAQFTCPKEISKALSAEFELEDLDRLFCGEKFFPMENHALS